MYLFPRIDPLATRRFFRVINLLFRSSTGSESRRGAVRRAVDRYDRIRATATQVEFLPRKTIELLDYFLSLSGGGLFAFMVW